MLLAVPLLLAGAAGHQAVDPRPLAITHVTIVDTAGGPAQPDMTVLIRDGCIAGIEKGGSAPAKDVQLLDGRDKFLVPGLWDMHVHLSWTTEGVACPRGQRRHRRA